MSNSQYSALYNDKMSCQTQSNKFPSKLLLGKELFTLTLVDLEYETSVSIWDLK